MEKVREKSYMSIVKMPLEWFDKEENAVSTLIYSLNTQANDIYQVGYLLVIVGTFHYDDFCHKVM